MWPSSELTYFGMLNALHIVPILMFATLLTYLCVNKLIAIIIELKLVNERNIEKMWFEIMLKCYINVAMLINLAITFK